MQWLVIAFTPSCPLVSPLNFSLFPVAPQWLYHWRERQPFFQQPLSQKLSRKGWGLTGFSSNRGGKLKILSCHGTTEAECHVEKAPIS